MSSREYLYKLEKKLKKLPQEERKDAIAYYEELFADAGENNVSQIIDRIGSPTQVATGILADAAAREFRESEQPKVRKGVRAVWLAVLGVFALPVALPLGIAGVVVVFALLISVGAVYLSLAVSSLAIVLYGLASTIVGFLVIPQSFPTAIFSWGSGLVLASLGALLGVGVYQLTKITLRGISNMFNRMRYRKLNKLYQSKDVNNQDNNFSYSDVNDGRNADVNIVDSNTDENTEYNTGDKGVIENE